MSTAKVVARCLIGLTLGVVPGLVIAGPDLQQQGLGLAILGGMLGLVLALAAVLYKSSAGESFWRGLVLFLAITLKRNHIPGADAVMPEDLGESAVNQSVDIEQFDRRMNHGGFIGAM